ncbi:MAG TPA: FAD-dependent monooxygenase, partial [Gaiellaceae bacterium]|nr:FAD-dependent monooxygenase [Gaiellaceae bacterium]
MRAHEEVPVLVVGGSLVGLSTSLVLGRHGVEHLVVERHPGTAIHPRAAYVFQRSVEAYRSVGIEAEVLAAAEREFVQNGAIMSVESLGGPELEWYARNVNEGLEGLSPSPRLFVTQIGLEPVLKQRAAELGGRLEYSSEVLSLEPDADGATALIRDRESGEERTVRARYVVAADGAHSSLREQFGIGLEGHGTFSDSITIYFRADVRELIGDRNLSVVYVFHPRQQGFFRFSIDGRAGFLVVNSAVDETGAKTTHIWGDTSDEKCVEYVREALGAPDLPVEIEDVQRWNAAAVWGERFGEGRILLAGDAVHVMPPTGGYGGNTGIHDAFNLGWKLAYVLAGHASPDLLATYDAERRPVARLTVEQAYARYVLRLDPSLGKEGLHPLVDDALIDLGPRLRSTAIAAEPDDDGADWDDPRAPTGRPGVRAPHLFLDRDGGRVSTIDLVGTRFLLLAAGGDGGWAEAAQTAATELGVPLDVHRVGPGGELGDPDGAFLRAYGLE